MTRVLIIDDEESICWGLANLCQAMEFETAIAADAEQGLKLASDQSFDLIILDVRLPGIDGISAIAHFREIRDETPIVIITAFGDLQTAIDAIQQGAFEYIVKPFDLAKVRETIQQAITASQMNRLDRSVVEDESIDQLGMVGRSAMMQEVFKQIAQTTTSDAPVLITGESGTGKELTARAIHNFSNRSNRPFVPVNLASLNPSLAESELFGHVKGAFTGAESDRRGIVQQADGGTLFLDEIAEVPLSIQVKLLRVLDQGEVIPVGANSPVKTDFRLISATNQDLLSQINHGDFRRDLFYRLRTFEIRLPPLRERKVDIPQLVDFFLSRLKNGSELQATESFYERLKQLDWQGNVRELQSVVERAATLANGAVLLPEHVEATDLDSQPPGNNGDPTDQIQRLVSEWTRSNWDRASSHTLYDMMISFVDSALLKSALELADGQYSAAARGLGIHRTTLKRKLQEIESKEVDDSRNRDSK